LYGVALYDSFFVWRILRNQLHESGQASDLSSREEARRMIGILRKGGFLKIRRRFMIEVISFHPSQHPSD
jgi:hypothetical protein